jgi:hypothetical protein
MPELDPSHDLAHPVEGDGAWSESYYFNAYDPPSQTGFFTRIGIRPNEGTIDVGMTVWLPGDDLAEYRYVAEQAEMIDSDLVVGGARYRMLEQGRRWHLTWSNDDVTVDATFDALTPMIGADGQPSEGKGSSTKTRQMVGKGHLEQAGRWTGAVEARGTRYEWTDARGNRDKSWGPRRWGGPTMWRWFSINFGGDSYGEGVHFGGILIGTDAGDLHRGWVWKDGASESIAEWKVRTEVGDDGVTQRHTHVEATDKAGRVHVLDADVFRVHPGTAGLRPNLPIVNEGLARWTYEGQEGWGIAEYLHQLDDDAKPKVAID